MRHIQALLRRMELQSYIFGTLRNSCIWNRAIFKILAYLEPDTSSNVCQTYKIIIIFRVLAYSEQFIQAFSRIFRHIQGYWCIFRQTHRRAKEGEGRLPLSLFENRKKCSDFGKKGPHCVHLWVKCSISNEVLRVYRSKSSKIFPCGASFF